MSWVLSLARSGGTAGSQDGHETRRHRVRGPFPMGACLLLAGTLALAGCGSSSNSTVTFTQQQPDPQQSEPEPEPEPQTGGGTPPTDTTTTEDGDGDTDSGDTTSTDDGGQTSTQQPPPQTGGGSGGNQGSGNQGSGNQGSGGSGGGTGGGGSSDSGIVNNPPPNNNPPVSRSVNLPNNPPPQRSITRSGFDSIEAHSHIKNELFPTVFWKLNSFSFTEYPLNLQSGSIRIGNNVYLTEDTNTKVPDNYGWQGKRLTHGNTEAYIFTKKAGGFTSGTKFKDEYSLNSNGEFGSLQSTTQAGWLKIGLDKTVIQSLNKNSQITYNVAGITYDLFLNEFAGTSYSQGKFKVRGSYDGVPGYFKCYSGSNQICTIGIRNDREINGEPVDDYEFGAIITANSKYQGSGIGGIPPTWLFEPNNPNQVIHSSIEDHSRYYNYGWWLNKDNWSLFANNYKHGYNEYSLNEPVNPSGRTGTATYVGGAGGYYAFVHGEKGVLNGYPYDAREPGISGEFRAKARLEVNFTNNTMSGKIFNFTNPEGTPIRNNDGVKDWTVELLNGSYDPSALGVVGNKTKWYDGEHLIEGDGKWQGEYYEDTSIFMGQFLASYGAIGKMVGSFGTNRQ